ncbi:MAG: hypothetical protein ACRDJK_09765, partial [Actinomycetota bacterium]
AMDVSKMVPVATFCGKCDCGCPRLFFDAGAAPSERVLLTDDFGAGVRMSVDQFRDLIDQAASGRLGEMLDAEIGVR